MSQSLLKGFEVEMYTGRPDGTVVGPNGKPLGKVRADGMVVNPDGTILGKLYPDGSLRARVLRDAGEVPEAQDEGSGYLHLDHILEGRKDGGYAGIDDQRLPLAWRRKRLLDAVRCVVRQGPCV